MFTINQHAKSKPERLFQLLTNFGKLPSWIPEIKKLEVITDGPIGVGTKFKETRMMFGKEATETFEITEYVANKTLTMQAHSCGMLYTVTHHFHEESDGTRIELIMTGQAQRFFAKLMTPLAWLMRGMMKKHIAKDLANLAKAAESLEPPKLAQAA
jgi:uncharacterized protein YndB with AHSA1/START domain